MAVGYTYNLDELLVHVLSWSYGTACVYCNKYEPFSTSKVDLCKILVGGILQLIQTIIYLSAGSVPRLAYLPLPLHYSTLVCRVRWVPD